MTSDAGAEGSDIGTAPIDPDAQPARAPSTGSGRQEDAFFANAKRKHELELIKHDLGFIGKAVGSSAQAPTNIAAFLIVCLILFITISAFMPASPAMDDTRKWAFGLVTLVVGYLFGAGTKSK
ncbi:MAG: hypothetical protein H7Z39_03515 [Burkholderiaceae bacterium]|nr:hypothetical protein [Burkholderiaceae bacterium]